MVSEVCGASRRKLCLIPCVAMLAFLLSTSGASAKTPKHLANIRTFDIVIEKIDANECGLTEDDVGTSMRFVLSQSKMQISSSSPDYIYLNVNLLDDCSAANVSLEVNVVATVLSSKHVIFGADVWNDEALLGGRSNMRSRVLSAVEESAKRLVVAWSSVNP